MIDLRQAIYIYSQTHWELSEFREDIYMHIFANSLTFVWIKTGYKYTYIRKNTDNWGNLVRLIYILKHTENCVNLDRIYINIFANILSIEWIKKCYIHIYIYSQTHWQLCELIHAIFIRIYSQTHWQLCGSKHAIYICIFANTLVIVLINTGYIYIHKHRDNFVN